jgi:hypothetical protein
MFGSSQVFGGNLSQASVASETSRKQQWIEDKQSCLPVTILQVEQAVRQRGENGGELRFFGEEAGMLLLVGNVESVARQASILEMSVNDTTGRIRARSYLSEAQRQALESLKPGQFVSLFGMVRTAPALHFAAAGVRLVESADEVAYHMIEVAHAALRLMALQKEASKSEFASLPTPTIGATMPVGGVTGAFPATPAKKELEDGSGLSPPKLLEIKKEGGVAVKAEPGTAAAQGGQGRRAFSGAGLRAAIVSYLQREGESRAEGVSMDLICAHLAPTPAADVKESVMQLVGDGEVFSTIDEEHFNIL